MVAYRISRNLAGMGAGDLKSHLYRRFNVLLRVDIWGLLEIEGTKSSPKPLFSAKLMRHDDMGSSPVPQTPTGVV